MAMDQHTLIFEARAYLEGLQKLFSNMQDQPVEYVQPFELVLLLQPVTDRLTRLLGDRAGVT